MTALLMCEPGHPHGRLRRLILGKEQNVSEPKMPGNVPQLLALAPPRHAATPPTARSMPLQGSIVDLLTPETSKIARALLHACQYATDGIVDIYPQAPPRSRPRLSDGVPHISTEFNQFYSNGRLNLIFRTFSSCSA